MPLVVGGDPHGRGVVATANYVARRFGVVSAMSCAEALRRCPQAVFVRPRGALYREYSREVWSIVREIVPTVEQAGIDEGYLDLGEVAPAFDDARALAEAVQAVVTRADAALVLARRRDVEGRRQGRVRPAQARRADGRAARAARRRSWRRSRSACCRASARAPRRGSPPPGSRRSAALAALEDGELRAAPPGQGRAARARPRARHRPAAARGLDRAHLDLDRGDVRARRRRRRAAARRAAPDGRRGSPATCASAGRPRGR